MEGLNIININSLICDAYRKSKKYNYGEAFTFFAYGRYEKGLITLCSYNHMTENFNTRTRLDDKYELYQKNTVLVFNNTVYIRRFDGDNIKPLFDYLSEHTNFKLNILDMDPYPFKCNMKDAIIDYLNDHPDFKTRITNIRTPNHSIPVYIPYIKDMKVYKDLCFKYKYISPPTFIRVPLAAQVDIVSSSHRDDSYAITVYNTNLCKDGIRNLLNNKHDLFLKDFKDIVDNTMKNIKMGRFWK